MEGDAGDAAHAAAMKLFSVKEFGSTHVQGVSLDRRMCHVGIARTDTQLKSGATTAPSSKARAPEDTSANKTHSGHRRRKLKRVAERGSPSFSLERSCAVEPG